MDSEKKKKIAIIASIIGGSVIVLALSIWALVSAVTNPNPKNTATNMNTNNPETNMVSPTPSNTASETVTTTPEVTATDIPVITTQSPTPTVTTQPPTKEPTPTPTAKPLTFQESLGSIKYKQNFIGDKIARGTTDLSINIPVKVSGEIFIVVSNSDLNLSLSKADVIRIATLGNDSRILNEARDSKNVVAGSEVNFNLHVENKKVDIFLFMKSNDGREFKEPIKTSFTPEVVPRIQGDARFNKDNGTLNVNTDIDGFVNCLIVSSDLKRTLNINEIINVIKNQNQYKNAGLVYYARSSSATKNHTFNTTLNNGDDYSDFYVVLVPESRGNVYNAIYYESKLEK